jgi:5S rRNA maturation endonuclease (ribonuclease M5)
MTSHQLFRICTFTHDMDNFKIIKIISRYSEIITLMDIHRTDIIIRELLEKYLKISKRTDINPKDNIPVSTINDDILIIVKFDC